MNNRVANCQLEDILRGENYGVECDEWNDTNIHDIATDLLEANVLVDKQCELIKEMREQLSAVVSTASTPTTKGELVYVNNYIEMREILNKSKEYT
jgi:hypothetical protein